MHSRPEAAGRAVCAKARAAQQKMHRAAWGMEPAAGVESAAVRVAPARQEADSETERYAGKRYRRIEMAIEIVREYLKQWGADQRILEFDTSSATVELAAQAVGCEPARIAKTLSFKVHERCVLIVAAGDARVDNSKYKAFFHTKAKMLTADEATELVGHAVGGVCPFGVKPGVEVYLDESLKRFETVFPAAGSSNSAIEVTMEELERYSGGQWIDVCKGY